MLGIDLDQSGVASFRQFSAVPHVNHLIPSSMNDHVPGTASVRGPKELVRRCQENPWNFATPHIHRNCTAPGRTHNHIGAETVKHFLRL
jgi:hypothetical protein